MREVRSAKSEVRIPTAEFGRPPVDQVVLGSRGDRVLLMAVRLAPIGISLGPIELSKAEPRRLAMRLLRQVDFQAAMRIGSE